MSLRPRSVIGGALVAFALVACGQAATKEPNEPVIKGAPSAIRRLSEEQYRGIIANLFGANIVVAGRFDPVPRGAGLLAVGAGAVAVTPSGFARYEDMARGIAAQVVDADNRDVLIPCKPASDRLPDEACARQFYARVGRMLYRRPLTAEELQSQVAIADGAARTLGGFYKGLASGLAGMLAAPDFIYVTETAEPDPNQSGALRLDAFSKAARLSFLLWNTAPDEALLAAAEHGTLNSREEMEKQVDRMLASPRLAAGVRAFFNDMLGFDGFETLEKDGVIYPAFNQQVAADAREQTLRTIADLLVTRHGDYRDLFTSRKTFISRPLALLYRVPAKAGWAPYEFPDGDPHVGIQAEPSFVALHSHPGTSSPTLRGRALREVLLCQKIPDPPANVSFDQFNDPNSPLKTTRERLEAHRSNPTCAGCHKLMDPIGVTLENFDGAGQFRATENGEIIDASGDIDGKAFTGADGLGRLLHDSPAVTTCLVNRLYAYATAHTPAVSDKDMLSYLDKSFAGDGYRLPELLRRIAVSEAFYRVMDVKEGKS